MTLDRFHPAVASWFAANLGAPTACQEQAWEAVAAGRHTLIAAPTGSGKTLAGFLTPIDALVRDSRRAPLPDATRVLYVSPLKALGNDVHKNLEVPLEGIDRALAEAGEPGSGIRAMVRTGDTPSAARAAMRRQPPHILVTTPESLYILLTSEGGRAMLASVGTAIIDEIHAVAGNKRGAHLALSLERLDTLAGGFATRRGRRSAYLHRDVVNGELRARRGARLTAMTSGGAIPDNADYDVVLEPHGTRLGSVNEDFAIESLPGDIFQLGNTSWRILRIERSSVRVEDAHGQPPNLPFWLGEAPGRTGELSDSVCDLLGWLARRFEAGGASATDGDVRTRFVHELVERIGVGTDAAEQIVDYLCTAHAALGALPDRDTVVLERFFDESGGMQLVIHSRFGSRLNRAWGLALRKRFCRKFNFELQTAATENAIVLSLGESHSFALDEVARYLSPETVRDVLTQADARRPDVRRALAVERQRLAGHPEVPGRCEGPAEHPAHAGRGPGRRGVPGSDRVRREPRGTPRHPRPSAGGADHRRCADRGHGHRRARDPGEAARGRRDSGRRPRPHRAFAARGGSPRRPTLRVSRRCAARGAPHAGGVDAPRARSGLRGRYRTARCGRDRPGMRRGMARCGHPR